MTEASDGHTVRFHYRGTLDDGVEFDSSKGRDPVETTLGGGTILPAIEQALRGMAVGDEKSLQVPAADAFGPRDASLVRQVARSQLPDGVPIELGTRLRAENPEGQEVVLTIVALSETEVTLDANHPLAGRDLTFELELIEIL